MRSDTSLFIRISQGDKSAFDTFFAHYYPKLVGFARTFVGCEQQAEDVVADVLTNMLTHRERVFALSHVEAYLYSSVKNKALSSLRKQRKSASGSPEVHSPEPVAAVSASPHELLVGQELHTQIREIIQKFPPKRQLVFRLCREEGMSYQQVADLMGISKRTVEVHLKLAIKTLRQRVEEYLGEKQGANLVKGWGPLLLGYLFAG